MFDLKAASREAGVDLATIRTEDNNGPNLCRRLRASFLDITFFYPTSLSREEFEIVTASNARIDLAIARPEIQNSGW